jgi:hypothetical protein
MPAVAALPAGIRDAVSHGRRRALRSLKAALRWWDGPRPVPCADPVDAGDFVDTQAGWKRVTDEDLGSRTP